ncbi:MAG: Ppx/GppA phosphatase family protein [Actinomycetota bacterium]|jgi:exopolyphosphatase / guanosine-5'-triphosphate,3'-diphosphate pyrophosphatase
MRIAALDLGTNSFHLLVVDAHADGTFAPLAKEKEMLRLGDGVAREGRVPEADARRAVATVARFRSLAETAGSDEIVAFATSAIREADNGAELVDRIRAEAGVEVRVISGTEEARLIFEAVRASIVIDPGPALAFDLGGGSLEVMVGDRQGLQWSQSVKLGVARLTAELVRGDPPSAGDVRRLRERYTAGLAPLAAEVAPRQPSMVIGTSGTLATLARMAAARRSGTVPVSVNQLSFTRDEATVLHEQILSMPAAARGRLPGLDAGRADIIPTGTIFLLTAMELFGFEEITVCEWALREGIVLDAIGHHDAAEWSGDPRAIRRASVLELARRCNWDEVHSRQVARLAVDLFDQTLALHGLGPADREVLEHAGLLHDIGAHVSNESHHKHTAYLIQHGRLRGFSPEEVAALAALGRFHRGSDPRVSREPLASLSPEWQQTVPKLAALLRLADGLDRSRSGGVEVVRADLNGSRVKLSVESSADVDVDIWGARRKRELFEKLFDRRLEVLAG